MKQRNSLRERYAESARTKDAGTGGGPFNFPAETKYFKPKEGRNRIIIVPYQVKSKNHPLIATGKWKLPGAKEDPLMDYLMDVWVHQRVGGGEIDVVCLKKNYHKTCPVCELADEMREKGKEKEYKALKPSRRVVYNVLNARNIDAGLMIFTTSHYLFEHELIEEALADGGDPIDFASVDEGKVVCFRGSMTSMGDREFMEFKSFSFEDREREERIDEKMVDKTVALDEVLKVMSYDEIQSALYGQVDEEEDDKGSRGHHERQDRKDEEEESTHPRHREREESKEERSRDRDHEDDRDRRDHKDREEGGEKKGKCPYGHAYPEAWDSKDDCTKCKIWDKCGDDLSEKKKADKGK